MPLDDNQWPALFADRTSPLSGVMAQILAPHIGPFSTSTAQLIGNDGAETVPFGCVLHSGERAGRVPIDAVAAVVDCYDLLSAEELTAAYQRIGAAKAVRKSDSLNPASGEKHMTMGLIVARQSLLNLEQISNQVEHLNQTLPSHFWPDAIAILEVGIVNYTARTPATERSGDFYLPAEEIATNTPVPSVWVTKTIRASGARTVHKIVSLLVARLAIFERGAGLPDYQIFLEGFPAQGIATLTYQFNLAGVLVAMTREQSIAGLLPREIYEVVSGKQVLGTVHFREWQDGGVFVVRGKFPIEMFLVFLRQVVPGITPRHLQYFNGNDERVSYVLPIQYPQFLATLAEFERRSSNMAIRRQKTKWLVQQIGNEGSSSPFVARLMVGVLGMRDAAYADTAGRDHFDELYEPILTSLRNARDADRDIRKLWTDHRDRIVSGEIVRVDRLSVQIREHIDRPLLRDLEGFLNTAVRSIKTHLQALATDLGYNIGFLFQKEPAFQAGIANLRGTDPVLADYLAATRLWNEPLVNIRNNLEHGLIRAPKPAYRLEPLPVHVEEPVFEGRPICQFTADALDRICCLVEELVIYMLRTRLQATFAVAEIPLAERQEEMPERFRLTVAPGGNQGWNLTAHTRRFSEV